MKHHISNIVSVEKDAIISKILAEKAQITTFGFDAGQSIQTHTSVKEARAYVLEGCMIFTIDNQTYEVMEGEYVELPSNIPHALYAKQQSKMLLVMKEEK